MQETFVHLVRPRKVRGRALHLYWEILSKHEFLYSETCENTALPQSSMDLFCSQVQGILRSSCAHPGQKQKGGWKQSSLLSIISCASPLVPNSPGKIRETAPYLHFPQLAPRSAPREEQLQHPSRIAWWTMTSVSHRR